MILMSEEPDGRRRLQDLDLTWPEIENVLLYGHAERATYTEHDAPSVGEAARWSRNIQRMSGFLTARGWTRINPMNQPTLIHPSNGWSLIICSGDGATGTAYANPRNRNEKGRSIREAVVDANQTALFLPQDARPELAGLKLTWILLYNHRGDKIYSEVSLPIEMEGDFITKWQTRILMPVI